MIAVEEENVISEEDKPYLPSDLKGFDNTVEYSDTSYRHFIKTFKKNTKKRIVYRFIKRLFDFILALIGSIILFPLMFVLLIVCTIDSRGYPIFSQLRMGKDGKPFHCLKFRTMRKDAPKNTPTEILNGRDFFVTKVGKVLRKFSLDELPQLWCVIIGTMSLVGHRPVVLTEKKLIGMRRELGVDSMRPGITGYAQVNGRDDVYYKNKAILDAKYVQNASVIMDIKILVKTFIAVFKNKGVR